MRWISFPSNRKKKYSCNWNKIQQDGTHSRRKEVAFEKQSLTDNNKNCIQTYFRFFQNDVNVCICSTVDTDRTLHLVLTVSQVSRAGGPGGPGKPWEPSLPRGPTGPWAPAEPFKPFSPLGPIGPRVPLMPEFPGGPDSPTGPVFLLTLLI